MFFSAKPISPLPVAPCWPRNARDRFAARHDPDWATVAVVVVLVVVLDVELVALLDGLEVVTDAVVEEAWVLVLFELDPPQPAKTSASAITARARNLMAFISGKAHRHPA
jgi:hypothetical protein